MNNESLYGIFYGERTVIKNENQNNMRKRFIARSSFALNFIQCEVWQTLDILFDCFPSSSPLTAKFNSSEKLSQQFTVC